MNQRQPEPNRPDFGPREERALMAILPLALDEDLGQRGDLTSTALIPAHLQWRCALVARADGVLAGMPVAERLARHFDLGPGWTPLKHDQDRLHAGDCIAQITGPARSLLAFERLALNFLQRLSGIASLTARYVAAIQQPGSRAQILDTRKTIPGWRVLEKYAVRQGGGLNHRMGLDDAILIKDNHLTCLRAISGNAELFAHALALARAAAPVDALLTIEVDTLPQFQLALPHQPDVILLDNFSLEEIREAVSLRDRSAPQILLEASGGVSLETAARLAQTGIDRISVGAITHSAPALDIALDFATSPI